MSAATEPFDVAAPDAANAAGAQQDGEGVEPLAGSPSGPGHVDGLADGVAVFGARWCAPWRLLSAQIAELNSHGAIRFVDVDECPELADRHRVTVLPCVLRHESGRETARLIGGTSASTIARLAGLAVTDPPKRSRRR